ncbi:hypothetical protein F5B21DRAFT_197985 [Xylaria acuta]|nr:hypothetical protein F5B21DRAFT_197985 [Xylaria acuta]
MDSDGPRELNLWEFAETISTKFLEFSFSLLSERGDASRKFSKRLAPELLLIQNWLESACHDQKVQRDEKARQRVEKLLRKFEGVCRWTSPDEIQKPEDKTQTQEEDQLQPDLFLEDSSNWANRGYPQLYKLLSHGAKIPHGLQSFARRGRPEDQERFIEILSHFDKGNRNAKQQAIAATQSESEKEEPVKDYSSHVQYLHQAVFRHCICQQDEAKLPIIANIHLVSPLRKSQTQTKLRLNSKSSSSSSGSSSESPSSESSDGSSSQSSDSDSDPPINFHVLFLGHPHGPVSLKSSRWHDTLIAVSRPKKVPDSRRVKWQDNRRPQRVPKSKRIDEHTNGFCGLISTGEQVRLPLVFSEDELKFKDSRHISRTIKLDKPSIPLDQVIKLDHGTFTLKKRLVLSFLLAKATWQYYESNWMAREWNKNTVHFMFESRRRENGIFVDEPFLHTDFLLKFMATDGSDDGQGAGAKMIHKFPKILALGIMLIEINLGVRIEDFRTPQSFGPDGKLTANADAIIAENLSKDEKKWKESSKTLKNAIKFCMNPGKVVKKLSRRDVASQREQLLQHVVKPLRRLCLRAFEGRLKLSAIDLPIPASKSGTETQPSTVKASPSGDDNDCNNDHDKDSEGESTLAIHSRFGISLDGPMSAGGIISSSETWFSLLTKMNNILRAKGEDKDEHYKPVKVAVLDTGILEKYGSLVQNRYKDYVSFNDNPTDTSSSHHGTSIFRLILKTFKDAEIYAARVFEQDKVNGDLVAETQERIAKAIRHATTEWKVDVVVMALGFETDHHDMTKAIMEAKARDILVFAAASNYGNAMGIAFPARLHHDVICMFCTNASVTMTQGINPRPSDKRAYNLAIFGEDVELGPTERKLTGTSMSTAIGAALAARLIDFSRHKDSRENLKGEASHLKFVAGMESVLSKMAGGPSGDGYYCVAPWRLLESTRTCVDRAAKRAAICETIKVALRERY